MTKRTPKTTKPEPTAAETYAARRNDIARLMDVLQMELDKHAEGAKADPTQLGLRGKPREGPQRPDRHWSGSSATWTPSTSRPF
jgi:hypothetical protein